MGGWKAQPTTGRLRTGQRADMSWAWMHYPLASGVGAASLGTVSRLDDIGLEADGARPAVQLEKEAASVAEYEAVFITAPERRGTCRTVLANGLAPN